MRCKSFILVNLQKAYQFSLTLLKLLKTNSMKIAEKQENVYFYLGTKQESKDRTAGSPLPPPPSRVQPLLAHPIGTPRMPGAEQTQCSILSQVSRLLFRPSTLSRQHLPLSPQPHRHSYLSALTWAIFHKSPRGRSPKHITSLNLSQNTYKEIHLLCSNC